MKVVYICDCCQEILGQSEINDEKNENAGETLTGIEGEGIISMAQEERYCLVRCDDCLEEFYPEKDFAFLGPPVWH